MKRASRRFLKILPFVAGGLFLFFGIAQAGGGNGSLIISGLGSLSGPVTIQVTVAGVGINGVTHVTSGPINLTINPSGPVTPPTANLTATASGVTSNNITIPAGTPATYNWTTNGAGTSYQTILTQITKGGTIQAKDACMPANIPGSDDSAVIGGLTSGSAGPYSVAGCEAGYTYTFVYTVTNSAGSAPGTLVVTVPSGPPPVCGANGQTCCVSVTPCNPGLSCSAGNVCQATTATLTLDGSAAARTVQVGDPYTLAIASNIKSTSFDFYWLSPTGVQTTQANDGSTDGSGAWTTGGSIPNAALGTWQEWVVFPTQGNYTTNRISFTITPAGGGPVNGVCAAPPNGGTYASTPSGPYCSAGVASALSGSGPWTWSCAGTGGGTTASCNAAKSAGGCVTNADCNDGNACTTDTCNVGTGVCSNTAVGGTHAACSGNSCVSVANTAGACTNACTASPNTCLTPVNGTCGNANGKTYAFGTPGYGSDLQCSQGVSSNPSFPSAGNSQSWICNGTGGGANSGSCSASQSAAPIVNGACAAPPNGNSYSSAPSGPYCSAGTASALSGAGPWTWTCAGSGGGTTASCNAAKTASPVNGACSSPPNGSSFSSAPSGPYCTAGNFSGLSGAGPWTWTCAGLSGGSNASCNATFTAAPFNTVSFAATSANDPNPPDTTTPVTLTANVGGTEVGTMNYNFWWNCPNPTTDVSTAEGDPACGMLLTPAPGSCATNANGEKCDAMSVATEAAINTYGTATTYTPKVIIERGPPSETIQQKISLTVNNVAAPTITGISISCSTYTLSINGQTTCTGTVSGTGAFDPSVTWSVPAGQGTFTPIDSTHATYTAPSSAVSATITGASTADPSQSDIKTITVVVPPSCVIAANPTSIVPPQKSSLSWTSSNAINCSIDQGIGAVSLNGSLLVAPAANTVYTLTCNGAGATTCTQNVSVDIGSPTIHEQ